MTSPVTSAARSPSPLTLAFENVKKVGNSLNKPEKFYLGKNFQALDHIPLPAESTTLAAAQARLKELVDSSENPNKVRLENTIQTVLKMIFKTPDDKSIRAKSIDTKNQDENDLAHLKAKVMQVLNLRTQLSPSIENQLQNIQYEMSVLLFLSDLIYLNYLTTSINDVFLRLTEEIETFEEELMQASINNGEMLFTLKPSTPEGIAFLCKWAKLLKAKDSSFYLENLGQLTPTYYKALRSTALESIGEVKKMAEYICKIMEWNVIKKEIKNAYVLNDDQLAKLHIAWTERRTITFLTQHVGTWYNELINYLNNLPKKANSNLAAFIADTKKSLKMLPRHLIERNKHLRLYRQRYQELHSLGDQYFKKEKRTQFSQLFNFPLWKTSILRDSDTFVEPEVLEARPLNYNPLHSLETSLNEDEKESSSPSTVKKKSKNRRSSQSKKATNLNSTANAPSLSSTITASSSPTNLKAVLSSSLSVEESTELCDPESASSETSSRSPSPVQFSDLAAENSFSLLNLDSPSARPRKDPASPPQDLSNSSSPDLRKPKTAATDLSSSATRTVTPPSSNTQVFSARTKNRQQSTSRIESSRPRALSSSSNLTSHAPSRPTSASTARPLTAPAPSRSQEPKADRKQNQPSETSSSFPRSVTLSPSSLTRSISNKSGSLTSSIVARPLSDEQTPTRSVEASADSKVNASYTASSFPEQPKRALPRTTSWGHLPSTRFPAIKEPLDDEKQNKSTRDRILEGGMEAIDYDDRVKKQRKDDPGGLHDFPDIIDLFVGTKHSRKSPWFDELTMRNQPLHEIFCQINTGVLPPEYVIIGYTFNEQSKKCYHRFAAKKSKIEFINAIVNQVKYQVANPTPSESTRLNQAPEEVSEQRNGQTFTFKVLPPHDIVFFKDEQGKEYRLFKMG